MRKLETHFGPYDLEGDAEQALSKLEMKDTHHISRYMVDFNRHAARLGWNDTALKDQFFRGLPTRLRTEIIRFGKPRLFADMCNVAQNLDNAHWAMKEETSRDSRPAPKKDTKSSSSSSNSNAAPSSSSSNQQSSASTSRNNNLRSANPQASSSSSKPRTDISDKLGTDGKIKAAERERSIANKLCLYCGNPGHIAKDCHKAGKACARGAQLEEPAPDNGSVPKNQ